MTKTRGVEMTLEELGLLLIRISVAGLFLIGPWHDAHDLKLTEKETALVFKWRPAFFANAGIAMMVAGAISILFGIFPRLGALALTVFLIPATMIHFRSCDLAVALKKKILDSGVGQSNPSLKDDVEELGVSAFVGNYSSGLKNLTLLGPTLYFVLAGTSDPMLIGFASDGTLQGFLTKF